MKDRRIIGFILGALLSWACFPIPAEADTGRSPHLSVVLSAPVFANDTALLSIALRNDGAAPAHNLTVTLVADRGLALAAEEYAERYLVDVGSQQETKLAWRIVPVDRMKRGYFKIVITGSGIAPLTVNGQIDIPSITAWLGFTDPGPLTPGQVVMLDLRADHLQDVQKFSAGVKYDPQQLRLIYVSRGAFLVEDREFGKWSGGTTDPDHGLVTDIFGIRSQPYSGPAVSLFRLNFLVIGSGNGQIELVNAQLVSSKGIERDFDFAPLQYQIEKAR